MGLEAGSQRRVLAALDMEEHDFARWAALAQLSGEALAAFVARGGAMDEKFNKLAQDIAREAVPIVFNGERGLMVNANSAFHSHVGNLLCQASGRFAVVWCMTKTGVVKVGLRSVRGYSVIPLAQSMGGGGHAQASAFRMGPERLAELLSGEFNA